MPRFNENISENDVSALDDAELNVQTASNEEKHAQDSGPSATSSQSTLERMQKGLQAAMRNKMVLSTVGAGVGLLALYGIFGRGKAATAAPAVQPTAQLLKFRK